jgi:hypothetical protein
MAVPGKWESHQQLKSKAAYSNFLFELQEQSAAETTEFFSKLFKPTSSDIIEPKVEESVSLSDYVHKNHSEEEIPTVFSHSVSKPARKKKDSE